MVYPNARLPTIHAHLSSIANNTLSIPLHTSWTNKTVKITQIEKSNTIPPPVTRFSLWSNDTTGKLYRWSGQAKGAATDDSLPLYEFEADGQGGGTWSESTSSSTGYFESLWHGIDGASASCGGMGFYLGGWADKTSEPAFNWTGIQQFRLPGILTYNMETREWKNESSANLNTYGYIAKSSGVCVTGFGDNPLLFSLGGNTAMVNQGREHQVDFKDITFYDPGNSVWYSQETSGEIPPTRVGFCATGVHGQNGTYEIYIYGGNNENKDIGDLGDMWVLSLPAFRWFRIDAESPTRQYHTCTVVGKRQMLVFGGTQKMFDYTKDDEWNKAISVFDMTELKWSDKYDAEEDVYESPQVVQKWYNEGGIGSIGWSSRDIKTLFANGSTTTSEEISTSSSSSETSSLLSSDTFKPPVSAIAGGVVGGVAAIVLISAAFYFYRRRARKRMSPTEHNEQLDTEHKELDPRAIITPPPSELVDPHTPRTPPPWELESHERAIELDVISHRGPNIPKNGNGERTGWKNY